MTDTLLNTVDLFPVGRVAAGFSNDACAAGPELSVFLLQKADGTCNTSFKKTKSREQVMQALRDFVGGNTQILVGSQLHHLTPWFP